MPCEMMVRQDLLSLALSHLRRADILSCPNAIARELRNAWAIIEAYD